MPYTVAEWPKQREKPTRNHSTVTIPIEAKFLAAAQIASQRDTQCGNGSPELCLETKQLTRLGTRSVLLKSAGCAQCVETAIDLMATPKVIDFSKLIHRYVSELLYVSLTFDQI